jgi:hypothetical protein
VRAALGVVALGTVLGAAGPAKADTAAHVDDDQHGLAVLGLGSSVDAAWPLARAVYSESSLRPPALDEAHARVLVGETPDENAPAELRDLAGTRSGIHGDDPVSRRLLQSIALAMHVKGIVVVDAGVAPARASARVFVTTGGTYDPVRYDPDPSAPVTWGNGTSATTWTGAVQVLRRGFGEAAKPPSANPPLPVVAPVESKPPSPVGISVLLHPVPAASDKGKSEPKAFYQSPWFWAATGAAVFAGLAVYLATRNDSSDNIQLSVQVPK